MILAKVLGNVVATEKDPIFQSKKIMIVQPLDSSQNPKGDSLLAFDEAQAGVGDTVLVLREGNGCRQIWNNDQAPVNSIIVGIVDQVSTN